MKKQICIIPARKGSKRIKNKNIKYFFGKPIISHVIEKLKKSKLFSKIYISTDCNITENIAKKHKIDVLKRDKNLSDDFTDTRTVIKDAILKIEKKKLFSNFDIVCCVYPTSIFIKSIYLKLALKKIRKNKFNFIISAKKYEHPIFRSFYKRSKKLLPIFKNKNYNQRRTQEFKEVFHDAAQFYFGHKNSWKTKKNIIFGKVDFVEIPKFQSIDIDDKKDWNDAKILWKILKN